MTEDELIAAILVERDDPAPYRVYGDWLEQRGDPLGQLIALQLRNAETNLEDGTLLVQEKTHFIRYPALTPALDQWRARYRWRWGLIDRAELEVPSAEELRALLSHRSCVLLRHLQLELEPTTVAEVLAALTQRTPTLETLAVRAPTDEEAATAAAGLWERVPRLEQLELEGARLFDELHHARLRVLTLEGAPAIGGWTLPALEQIAWKHAGSVRSLAPLWSSELPALRKLRLLGDVETDYADDHFFAAIARLDQLEIPIEAFGITPRQALQTMIVHAARFEHLERLYVSSRPYHGDGEDEEEVAGLRGELFAAIPGLVNDDPDFDD